MNALKQKWKAFIIWLIEAKGLSDMRIDACEIEYTTYYPTNRRHDLDNYTPKFINDGLVESGFLIDDDSKHLRKITLLCGVDKENPRTEIRVIMD